jgi:hypothetical protein
MSLNDYIWSFFQPDFLFFSHINQIPPFSTVYEKCLAAHAPGRKRQNPPNGSSKRTYQSGQKRARTSWSSLKNKHLKNKCTYSSGGAGTYTTRSGNMKNSSSTYPASNTSSTWTCVTKNKSRIGTAYVRRPTEPKKPSRVRARSIKRPSHSPRERSTDELRIKPTR